MPLTITAIIPDWLLSRKKGSTESGDHWSTDELGGLKVRCLDADAELLDEVQSGRIQCHDHYLGPLDFNLPWITALFPRPPTRHILLTRSVGRALHPGIGFRDFALRSLKKHDTSRCPPSILCTLCSPGLGLSFHSFLCGGMSSRGKCTWGHART